VSVLRERILQRLAAKRAEYEDYRRHLEFRVKEEDLHGIWDCGSNMSEVSNYIDGLQFCLDLLPEDL